MRKTLSNKGVAALKPRAARYATPDPELRGHYIRVQPSGAKSFVAVSVDPQSGKQKSHKIGAADAFGIDEARAKAREVIKRVRSGLPPVAGEGRDIRPGGHQLVAAACSGERATLAQKYRAVTSQPRSA